MKSIQETVDSTYNEIQSSLEDLEKEYRAMQEHIRKLTEENKVLKKQQEKWQPSSTTIQLFHSHQGIQDIEEDLKRMLQTNLKRPSLTFPIRSRHTEINSSQILIVLRIIASRVGSDAASAIKDIKIPGNTALVLIHEKERHALPNESSSGTLTDQRFKDLGGIFDMAHIPGKGFYQCQMNNDSIKGICSYIKDKTSVSSHQAKPPIA